VPNAQNATETPAASPRVAATIGAPATTVIAVAPMVTK
jgi:hypothetical protein